MKSADPSICPSYKPSVYYFRKALREATNLKDVREVGAGLCAELEALKAFVRSKGLQPPRFFCTREEAVAKGWNQPEAAEEPAASDSVENFFGTA